MALLDKVLSAAKVSESVKPWVSALAGIGGLVLAVSGVRDFLIKNRLTTPEEIHRVLFVTDRRIEVRKILRKVATESNADRAFLFFYKQNENGQWFTEFKSTYQWQLKGQTHIRNGLYPLAEGADTVRFEAMNIGLCKESVVWGMQKSDPLAIALKKSNVEAQLACQVSAKIEGVERIGAITVEFRGLKYNKTDVESILVEASIDIEKVFR